MSRPVLLFAVKMERIVLAFASAFAPVVAVLLLLWPVTARAGDTREPFALSDSIGPEIDAAERAAYHLFPDVDGFRSAFIYRAGPDHYSAQYSWEDRNGAHTRSLNLTSGAVEATRFHVLLTEGYLATQRDAGGLPVSEAELIRRITLRQAAKTRYDVAAGLLEDLRETDAGGEAGAWAGEVGPRVDALRSSRRALLWPGSLLDQRGRTRLLIFSGYYGLWLGIATPIVLEAESPQTFSIGLLLGGPLSVLATHSLTKSAEMSIGRATIIQLGGHLGTWQGIGWADRGEEEGRTIVGVGEVAGVAGIAGAVLFTRRVEFSAGHAALTASGLQWGAWFGAVAAAIADQRSQGYLPLMLVGSDALVLVAGIAGRDVQMSETRVSLLNLAGLMGTVFGLGIDLLTKVEDNQIGFAVAGAGSVVGFGVGAWLTRDFDRGRDISLESGRERSLEGNGVPSFEGPRFALRRVPAEPHALVPTIEIGVRF